MRKIILDVDKVNIIYCIGNSLKDFRKSFRDFSRYEFIIILNRLYYYFLLFYKFKVDKKKFICVNCIVI